MRRQDFNISRVLLALVMVVMVGGVGCAPKEGAGRTHAAGTQPDTGAPMYIPGKWSKGETYPITSNAYGAYTPAPKAFEIGDTAPDFTLPRIDGTMYSLADARAAGPVVLVFYRGHW